MKWEENEPNNFYCALDIGTTKVCAIVGRRNDLGQIEILGHGREVSEGVQRGVVSNIDKTVRAITKAVQRAESQVQRKITRVNVGIAGQHIASRQNHGMITRDDNIAEITQGDLDKLVLSMRKLPLKPGEEILHIIPQDYCVDDEWGIDEPIGMCGTRLGANFHIITCQNSASKNIIRCVQRAELEVSDLTLEPIASAASVLTEADRRDGVVLVDIGGGTTDITIFADGVISHTCVLPFGGDVITSDIRKVFRITVADAEDLKTGYGSALANEVTSNRHIRIANRRGQEHTEISELQLAEVVQARMEEILRYVDFQISASDTRSRLQGGIVLTGGGSLLRNVDKLTELYTAIPTRVGLPVEHLAQGYPAELGSPIYATSIGLLIGEIELDQEARQAARASRANKMPVPVGQGTAAGGGPTADGNGSATAVVASLPTAAVSATAETVSAAAAQAMDPAAWFKSTGSRFLETIKVWFDSDEDPDMD